MSGYKEMGGYRGTMFWANHRACAFCDYVTSKNILAKDGQEHSRERLDKHAKKHHPKEWAIAETMTHDEFRVWKRAHGYR